MKNEKKKRRLSYHRDLGGLECFEAPLNVANFVQDFVGRVVGTHVDTFILHVIHNLYPSRLKVEEYVSETGDPIGAAGEHATWSGKGELTAGSWRTVEHMKTFEDLKFDPAAAMLEAAHKAGIDFFLGMRMNDVHHAQYHWHPRFWVEHPEFRIGDHEAYRFPRPGFREPGGRFKSQIDDRVPACFDYMHEEVRSYQRARIEEMARAYDVEGIELDFTRHPFFFKPPEVDAGRGIMTEFIAALRRGLNEIGNRRGRGVVLEARVPPTVEACRRIGLDVPQWIAARSVDVVTVASLWHPDFTMPIEEFLAAAKGTDCQIMASIETAEMPIMESAEATARVIRAAALGYRQAGVHGIQMFNMHLFAHYFRQEMPFLNEIGDVETLKHLDKHYLATRASNYDHVAWFSYPKALPAALRKTSADSGTRIPLRIGDDVEKALRCGMRPAVTLRLRIQNLTGEDDLEFKFNGIALPANACTSTFFPTGESRGVTQYSFMAEAYRGLPGPYHWLDFHLDGNTLPRVGINEVEVILRKRNSRVTQDIILSDVEIKIAYGSKPATSQ